MATLIEALQSSQEHYRHSVELNPQIPWITNETGAVVEVSPRWTILTGTSTQEALNWGWTAAVHPDDLLHVLEAWKGALAAAGINRQVDVRYRLKSVVGGFRWFRARALPRLGAQDNVLAWYGNLEDIDDQVIAEQALQSSEERYRLASLATNDVIWDVSLTRDTIEWSARQQRSLAIRRLKQRLHATGGSNGFIPMIVGRCWLISSKSVTPASSNGRRSFASGQPMGLIFIWWPGAMSCAMPAGNRPD